MVNIGRIHLRLVRQDLLTGDPADHLDKVVDVLHTAPVGVDLLTGLILLHRVEVTADRKVLVSIARQLRTNFVQTSNVDVVTRVLAANTHMTRMIVLHLVIANLTRTETGELVQVLAARGASLRTTLVILRSIHVSCLRMVHVSLAIIVDILMSISLLLLFLK